MNDSVGPIAPKTPHTVNKDSSVRDFVRADSKTFEDSKGNRVKISENGQMIPTNEPTENKGQKLDTQA